MAGSPGVDPYLNAAHGWATGAQLVYRPLAAFGLNHLVDPAAGFLELARVTRPGGALLASVYSTAHRSAARDQVDTAAHAHGFAFPDWYLALKANVFPLLGDAPAMARAAT